MSVTSGDPADLAAFLESSGPVFGRLAADTQAAWGAYQAFLGTGSADSGGLGGLHALVTLLEDLGANNQFLAVIGDALVAADTNGHTGSVTIPDAVIAGRLAAGGVQPAPGAIAVAPSTLMGRPPTSGFCDDPVCTATGNFFHPEVDLAFPGRSAALNLERSYNSLGSQRSGAFGRGWTSLLDVGLVVATNRITANLADGASISFSLADDGSWRGEARPRLHLAPVAGGFTLADGPQSGFVFDAAGTLLRRFVGRASVVVGRDTSGRVIRLDEQASGRSVALGWSSGRVVSAVSSDGREASYAYIGEHLVAVARPTGGVTYGIDTSGRIASVTDADGVILAANTYDDLGRVATQTSPFGRVSTYSYGPARVTVVAGAEGIRNAFVHDDRANLVSMVDGSGGAMRLRYDDAGRMVGWTDRRGGRWELTWNKAGTGPVRRIGPLGWEETFDFDGEDRILAHRTPAGTTTWRYPGPGYVTPSVMVEPGGATTVVEVSADDLAVAITDADGVTARLTHDADGQVRSITDALGNTTSLTYDAAGYLAAWRLPSSITVNYQNDAAGRVLLSTHPGSKWSFAWSPAGRAVAGVDPAEGPWQASFGPHGALSSISGASTLEASTSGASVSGAAGQEVGFTYDTCGNLTRLVGPDGRAYAQGFDAMGQLTSLTDPAGQAWAYRWSPEGELLGITDPQGRTSRRSTDLLGRTIEEQDGAGRTWRREWGADGRLSRVVDPAGAALGYRYDNAGRVVAISEDAEVLQELTWSAAGRLVGATGPDGARTSYTYDPAGRLVGIAGASGSVSLVVDVDGRVVRAEDERGRAVSLQRDEAGRVVSVTDRRGVVRRVEFDGAGRPVRAGAGAGLSTFTYDERGLLVGAASPDGGTTRFSYDLAGRLAEATDPLGGRTRYDYDPAGRLAAITNARGQTARLQRSPAGEVLGVTHPDGGGWRRWVDGGGLTAGYGEAGAQARSVVIQRDAAGRPLGQPRQGGRRVGGHGPLRRPGPARTPPPVDPQGRVSASPLGELYRHDAAGQLVEWVPAPGTGRPVAYRYDPGGRLVSEEAAGALTTYAYDGLNRLVRRVNLSGQVTTYAYDASGRRISCDGPGGRQTLRWDAAGRLAEIRSDEAPDRPSTVIAYDNLGLPVSVGGVPVSWDLGDGWPRVAGIGTTSFVREDGALVAVDALGGRSVVPVDWMGNAEPVSDPWGRSEGRGVRLGYRGELCLDGLVWLGARVYDPSTRCFLSPDPLPNPPGAPCGANPYHYAWNDPVSLVDPTGCRPLSQEEFEALKHQEGLGRLGQAWEAVRRDPWGDAMVGLTAVAGVGLMFVPGGQAVGAGILIGMALSAGTGVATGSFNPRMVALQGAVGGVTGGLGEAFQGAGLAAQIGFGAATGAAGSVLTQEVFSDHVDWGQVALSGGGGGVASGVGAKVGAARSVNSAKDSSEYVNLASEARTAHILDGEQLPDGTWSGGHRWPGADTTKTTFPPGWSDARIMHEISDVATDPSLPWTWQKGSPGRDFTRAGNPSRSITVGDRGGIRIKVVIEPAGEGIITAHPVPR